MRLLKITISLNIIFIVITLACTRDKSPLKVPLGAENLENYSRYILQEKIIEAFQFSDLQQTLDDGYIALNEDYGKYPKLTKFDSQFNISWSKEFTNIIHNNYYSGSLNTCSDGGCVFISKSGKAENLKCWCTKTNINGAIEWQKKLSIPNSRGNIIKQTSDNGFLILGAINAKLCNTLIGDDYCFTNYYTYIIKLDSEGNSVWTKIVYDESYIGREPMSAYDGIDFIETADGYNLLIYGGEGALLLYKTDINGIFLERKNLGGTTRFFKINPKYGFILGTNVDYLECKHGFKLRQLDMDGNQEWSAEPFINGDCRDALVTSNGQMVLAGTFYDYRFGWCGAFDMKLWLQSFNKSGEMISQWLYPGEKYLEGYRIFLNQAGNFVISGNSLTKNQHGYIPTGTFFMEVSTDCLTSTTTGIK